MSRKTLFAWPMVLALASCAGTPELPTSPSAATPVEAFANADGSSAKVSAPTGLRPHGVTLDTRRPTLSFENARTPAIAGVAFDYEIEVQNEAGDVVYSRIFRGTSSGRSQHTVETDFEYETNLWWRSRAILSSDTGPLSDWATVRTPDRPPPPPPPTPPTVVPITGGGALPFPIPASCAAGDAGPCAFAMLAVSPWWPACTAGSGVNCHRYVRSVAAALATADPNFGLITKNPGEQQCTWDVCGNLGGQGYGEDILAYHTGNGSWFGWDLVVGAGAPGAGPNFTLITTRRPGNNWAPVPPFP